MTHTGAADDHQDRSASNEPSDAPRLASPADLSPPPVLPPPSTLPPPPTMPAPPAGAPQSAPVASAWGPAAKGEPRHITNEAVPNFTVEARTPPSRLPKVVAALVVLALLGGGAWWLTRATDETVAMNAVKRVFTDHGGTCFPEPPTDKATAIATITSSTGLSRSTRARAVEHLRPLPAATKVGRSLCTAPADAAAATSAFERTAIVITSAATTATVAELVIVGPGFDYAKDLADTGAEVVTDQLLEPVMDSGGIGFVGETIDACRIERRTIEIAIAAFTAVTGAAPADLAALAAPPDGTLRSAPSPSDWAYDAAAGTLLPLPGGRFSAATATACAAG